MKKVLLITFITLAIGLSSCKKLFIKCYECQTDPSTSEYYDQGCYTRDEWEEKEIIDAAGQLVDKEAKCRKR